MGWLRDRNRNRWRCLTLSMGAVLLIAITVDATAQGRWGGPALGPEKTKAAWELQVGAVCKDLGASKDVAAKVFDAFQAAQKSYRKGMAKLRASGAGGQGMWMDMQDLRDAERGKLKAAFKGILPEGQVAKAMASLGAFNRQWDRYVDTLTSYKLETAKMDDALALTVAYVVDFQKAFDEAMANMDFQSMRQASREIKGKLDSGLSKILSGEQLAKWNEATARRGRGGRGGGGRGGGARGPSGAGPTNPETHSGSTKPVETVQL